MTVRLCIFCGTRIDRTTKPEHILHDALGGRKTTRRVVCSVCNNRFGGSIDKALAEQFGVVRTLLQLRSGAGGLPPMLKRVTAGNEKIDIKQGGRLKLASKPFEIITDNIGRTQLHISGESLEKIEAMVPHMGPTRCRPSSSEKMDSHRRRSSRARSSSTTTLAPSISPVSQEAG
jgi:hypothetical protein